MVTVFVMSLQVIFANEFKYKAEKYDLNKNGSIDTKEEARVLGIHAASSIYRKYDKNMNGKLDTDELRQWQEDVKDDAATNSEELLQGGKGMSVADASKVFLGQEKKVMPPSTGGYFVLRKKVDDFSMGDALNLKNKKIYQESFKGADGAKISFKHNAKKNSDTWNFDASLLYIFPDMHEKNSDGKKPYFSSWYDALALTLNREDTNSGDTTDSMIFRGFREGYLDNWNFLGFDQHLLRASLVYATDTHFRASIPAIELDWSPLKSSNGNYGGFGFNEGRHIPRTNNSIMWAWDFTLHAETGYIIDEGRTNLNDDEFFARIGPRIGLSLWFDEEYIAKLNRHWSFLNRLTWKTEWGYLYGLAGEPNNSELLDSTLSITLDELKRYSLEVQYKKGDTPLLDEDVESWNVGFGIKF